MQAYIFAFIAIIFYALLPVIAKKLSVQNEIPPFLFMAITMGVITALSLILSLIYEKGLYKNFIISDYVWLTSFGIINLLGFSFYLFAIKHIPIAHYTLIGLLVPMIAGMNAYFWLGEKLGINFFIGY